MLSQACAKQDCVNWGNLLVDAKVIRYILHGTIEMLNTHDDSTTMKQKLPEVVKQ